MVVAWSVVLGAAWWGSSACARRPAIVGTTYWDPSPSVIDVVRAEVGRWPGGAPAEIRQPSSYLETHAEREVDGAGQLTKLPRVVAVLGHQDRRRTLLAAPVYHEAHVPLVVPTATSRTIGTASPRVFPLAPNDFQERAFIPDFATRQTLARTIALQYHNDD